MVRAGIEEHGLRPYARALGVPIGVLRSVQAGRDTPYSNLKALSDALGLEFYIGPPREQAQAPAIEISDTSFRLVNRLDGEVAAGNGHINYEAAPVDRLAFSKDWLKREGISAGDCFLVSVKGDSMLPQIGNGDLVMIDTRRKEIRSGRVYAMNDGDQGARIKRLEVIPDVGFILRSDNPAYEPEYRTGENAKDVDIIGQVVWSGHKWG
jgi:phage repressor protein C with HTH and peptisase S24 domain